MYVSIVLNGWQLMKCLNKYLINDKDIRETSVTFHMNV